MSWTEKQKKTINRLNNMLASKIAIQNLTERMEHLESMFDGLRAAKTDGDPVSGGTNHREDDMIKNICDRDETRETLDFLTFSVSEIERNIEILSPAEQLIITRIDINDEQYAIERLINELGYSQATIYRIRRVAIEKLAKQLYP